MFPSCGDSMLWLPAPLKQVCVHWLLRVRGSRALTARMHVMKLTFRSEYRMHCLATLQAGHRGGASSCASSGAHRRSARAATPVKAIRDDTHQGSDLRSSAVYISLCCWWPFVLPGCDDHHSTQSRSRAAGLEALRLLSLTALSSGAFYLW